MCHGTHFPPDMTPVMTSLVKCQGGQGLEIFRVCKKDGRKAIEKIVPVKNTTGKQKDIPENPQGGGGCINPSPVPARVNIMPC